MEFWNICNLGQKYGKIYPLYQPFCIPNVVLSQNENLELWLHHEVPEWLIEDRAEWWSPALGEPSQSNREVTGIAIYRSMINK